MKNLKKKTIRLFLLCLVILYITNSFIDSFFEIYLRKYPDKSMEFYIIGFFNIISSISVISIITVYFYKKMSEYFNEEMKNQMEKQNFLYSSIAHDIKTPMTLIKGYSDALLNEKIKKEDLIQTYININTRTDQVTKLLEELFEYSKLSMNTNNENFEDYNISELLKDCIIKNYDLIESKEMDLEVEIKDFVFLYIVTKDFKRMIENLIVNAVKHNEKNTKIRVGLYEYESHITISVSDMGELISNEDKKKIFDPFVKKDESRKTGKGSGLGLAIVKMIVEKHHGKISIEDNYKGYNKAFIIRFNK
ncbi:MAG: HAMP domain-containing sensor histidine kinase [Lagierella massiliensis]|nr:HAMP domain-containing sensor histidine kinase [Lagierella massiliensis]